MCNLEGIFPSDWSVSYGEETASFQVWKAGFSGYRFRVFSAFDPHKIRANLIGETVRLTDRAHPHLAVNEVSSGG
jgi:hypothetical protein